MPCVVGATIPAIMILIFLLLAIFIISSKFFSVSAGFIPLSISLAPRPKMIKSIPGSDKLHSAIFNPPEDVLPETLPLIIFIFKPSFLKSLSNTTDK